MCGLDTTHLRTDRRAAANKGLLQAGFRSNLEVRIFVWALLAGDSFSLVNPRLTASPEPLAAMVKDNDKE